MIDDRTRQLRVDGFRKAEASLRLEGMDPSGRGQVGYRELLYGKPVF